MAKLVIVAETFVVSAGLLLPVGAQQIDPTVGRHLAETICSECHQFAPGAAPKNPKFGAPSFADISRMPSTNGVAIKVFLRTSHPTMPNIMLSSDEIDSFAAYIMSLAKK
jgi:mono/diheme cytochrome c family protein